MCKLSFCEVPSFSAIRSLLMFLAFRCAHRDTSNFRRLHDSFLPALRLLRPPIAQSKVSSSEYCTREEELPMFLVSAPFLLVASPIVLVSPPNFSYQRFHSFLFQRVDLPGARTGGLPPIGGSPPCGARIIKKINNHTSTKSHILSLSRYPFS